MTTCLIPKAASNASLRIPALLRGITTWRRDQKPLVAQTLGGQTEIDEPARPAEPLQEVEDPVISEPQVERQPMLHFVLPSLDGHPGCCRRAETARASATHATRNERCFKQLPFLPPNPNGR
jgi:hypothetical protein